jgi:hypothetical protein
MIFAGLLKHLLPGLARARKKITRLIPGMLTNDEVFSEGKPCIMASSLSILNA